MTIEADEALAPLDWEAKEPTLATRLRRSKRL